MATHIGTQGDDEIVRPTDEIIDDILIGLGGDDDLRGGGGNDVYIGGPGADLFVEFSDDLNDTASYETSNGVVVDFLDVSLNAGEATGDKYIGIENLRGSNVGDALRGSNGINRIDGGGGNDFLAGRGGDDQLFGGDGNDILIGGTGADLLNGGNDIDVVDYSAVATAVTLDLDTGGTGGEATGDTFINIENVIGTDRDDIIGGNGFDNVLEGRDGDDVIAGKFGNDILIGGEGHDVLAGGVGADQLIGGAGLDIADYSDAIAAVTVDIQIGGLGGDAVGDIYESIEGIKGSGFSDTLRGFIFAADHIAGDDGDDVISGLGGSDELRGESGSDTLNGGSQNDSLFGDSGDDILDGGDGADRMTGGIGSDTYIVDDNNDVVDESVQGGGTDEVRASFSFSLANPVAVRGQVENVTLTGGANINATGNDLSNFLVGNSGENTIIGGAGFDLLFGNAGKDVLQGGTEGDVLDGGSGVDIMQGGAGSDTYVVDNVGDIVDESGLGSNGANDRVEATISFSLVSSNVVRGVVEHLQLAGDGNINGTGNALDNSIEGNEGRNILSGGAGNDDLEGGEGSDRLDGGAGSDFMEGGNGNDVYVVDNAGDTVDEAYAGPATGIDTVQSSVSFSLVQSARVIGIFENLVLTGVGNTQGTGNSLANTITGNNAINLVVGSGGNDLLDGRSGSDTLNGGVGNDQLIGGAGGDRLTGGTGADDFVFTTLSHSRGATRDTILDFSHAQGDDIVLSAIDANSKVAGNQAFSFLGAKAFSGRAGQLRFEKVGSDTHIQADVNGDQVADLIIVSNVPVSFVKGDFVL